LNFPWVVLGRALYHHARVKGRTHANRSVLALDPGERGPSWVERLPREHRSALERCFRRLRDGAPDGETLDDLTRLLVPLVAEGSAGPSE
jgi:hypothetical protein